MENFVPVELPVTDMALNVLKYKKLTTIIFLTMKTKQNY